MPKTPLVFCFDQIEALEMDPGDNTGLFQFGQMARELKIETQNTVLITCVQTQFLDRLKTALSQWAYDSLREFGMCFLHPLTLPQARRLMEARLAALRLEQRNGSPQFSLTDQQLGRIVGQGCTPRRLLAELARLYDGQTPEPEKSPVDFLRDQWDRLEEQAEKSHDPAELPDILSAALPTLLQLAGGCKMETASGQKDIEFSLVHPDGKIGVSLCTQPHLTSLAARLRHLLEILRTDNPWQKLILFRHPHMPVGKPGQKSKERWDELQKHGAEAVYPPLKTIAALQAPRELLATAKAGDLSFSGAAIPLKTVEDWLIQELPDSLRELVETIIRPPAVEAGFELPWDTLSGVLSEECILPLEDAARRAGCSPETLRTFCEQHPEHVGFIPNGDAGKPAIIYRLEASAEIG